MVGVPGRSKGCSTCRRRKKGCDRKRPICTQCSSAGLECGGYERKRIFLNYTQYAETKAVVYRKGSEQTEQTPGGGATSIVLPDGLAQTAYVENYISIFLQRYLPTNRWSSSRDWIEIAHELHTSDQAIHFSLLSLGLFAAGESQYAIQSYCHALHKLGTGLCIPSRAQSNSTLAACKLLGLVEIFHGTEKNALLQGLKWNHHVSGLLAIINTRSPYLYQSGVSHQLFADGRYPLFAAAIGNRQRAPLNTPEWRTIPWEKEPKSPMHKLYDFMADLSEILAGTDDMRCCEDPVWKAGLREKLIRTCQCLDQSLKDWLKESGPLTTFNDGNKILIEPFGPSDLPLAHMTLLYWTLYIILYSTLISIYDPPLSVIPAEIDPAPYLRNIANALPYFWSTDAGLCGAALAAIPWGLSLQVAYATPHRFPEEIMLLEQFASQDGAPKMILQFLNSLQRDSGGPEFAFLNGREGMILRAQRWMMASSKSTAQTGSVEEFSGTQLHQQVAALSKVKSGGWPRLEPLLAP
ncbi:hypothetical protein GGR55DRAFT_672960 [Xylaria sp. FL0064]|nr:hypothetical protein GGR55DRAFT_672960 [Xylaria sp. FL0064]